LLCALAVLNILGCDASFCRSIGTVSTEGLTMQWVVLTLGDRPAEVRAALDSIVVQSADHPGGTLSAVIVLANGCASPDVTDMPDVRVTTDR
jgi:hypothetical protein